MYINNLIKKQIILSLATFLIVGLIIFGTSFALFETTRANTVDQSLAIGDLKVNYSNGSFINISDIDPMTDEEAISKTDNIYTFTINNTGSVAYAYTIKLIDNPDYLSGGSNYSANRTLLNHSYIRYSLNGASNFTLGDKTNGLIYTGVLNSNDSITFNLRLWIADATIYNLPNEALGSEVYLNILIDGQASKTASLADYIKSNVGSPAGTGNIEQVSEAATAQLQTATNYVYSGTNPNNYVSFNNELWRIIGVYQTEGESGFLKYRVKLIKNASIGNYSYDSSASSVNSGSGINEWSASDLMKLLNPGNEAETINNSLYYNKASGTCYNGASNATASCDFTTNGLGITARTYIDKVKYYLGGSTTAAASGEGFYTYERGTSVIASPSDGVTRKTNYLGYVGLPYPSDYAYSVSSETCARSTNLNSYTSCSSWLTNSGLTITNDSSSPSNIWYYNNGLTSINASSPYSIYPIVYLKSTVKKSSGTGTSTDPYIISL